MATFGELPREKDLWSHLAHAACGRVGRDAAGVRIVAEHPDLRAADSASVIDERVDECRPDASAASSSRDVQRVEEHRPFSVWMNEFMAVDPN